MPTSPLLALQSGDEVLIDANILVYGLAGASSDCVAFLDRWATADVQGFVTLDALADACHKLMILEAHRRGLIQRANASSLQGKTAVIRQLSDYWSLVRSLSGIAILPLDEFRFQRAQPLRAQYGLMTGDSLLLAAAEVFGIDALATSDSDFDAVPSIKVYRPASPIP
jgi:predicted nucleic acid-binding protein